MNWVDHLKATGCTAFIVGRWRGARVSAAAVCLPSPPTVEAAADSSPAVCCRSCCMHQPGSQLFSMHALCGSGAMDGKLLEFLVAMTPSVCSCSELLQCPCIASRCHGRQAVGVSPGPGCAHLQHELRPVPGRLWLGLPNLPQDGPRKGECLAASWGPAAVEAGLRVLVNC